MPCYKPLEAWKTASGVSFSKADSTHLQPIKLPCNQCVGCRIDRSRSWAVRCVHEAQMHHSNCFLTLTYNDENIPENHGLKKSDFQKFMKRLRKRFSKKKIRYYMCGEYGENFGRPHYHVLLFGLDFRDKQIHRIEKQNKYYRSKTLEKLWPLGYSEISDVTFQSAAYVARYVMKKITGELADNHYEKTDPDTGEIYKIEPEYNDMSRRPGIGKTWFEKYGLQSYVEDTIRIKGGAKVKIPRYYDQLLEKSHPKKYEEVKKQRQIKGKELQRKYENENTPDRLKTREYCAEQKAKRLQRTLA